MAEGEVLVLALQGVRTHGYRSRRSPRPASQISPIRFADHFSVPAHTGSGIAPYGTPAAAVGFARVRIFYREFLWFLRHVANNPLQSKILQDRGEEGEDSFIENKGVLSQNPSAAIP